MNLLDLIFAHPVFAFFMAWPIGLTIISVSWHVALTIENGMNLLLQMGGMVVTLFRGYNPPVIPTDDSDEQS